MLKEIDHGNGTQQSVFETISAHKEGGVLFAEIAAPPMNLLGPNCRSTDRSVARLAVSDANSILRLANR